MRENVGVRIWDEKESDMGEKMRRESEMREKYKREKV